MIEAGIKDPESQEGIDFCLNHCPYDRCIVFEAEKSSATTRRDDRKARAWELYSKGYSRKEIAVIVGKSERSIERYLSR